MASQTQVLTGSDVFREVVDIERLLRGEVEFRDGVAVDGRIGLVETHFVGEDPSLKLLEYLVVLEKPRDMHAVGVGEEDELEAERLEEGYNRPHRTNWMENGIPGK